MAVGRRKRSAAAPPGGDGSGGDHTESSSLSSIHDMAFPNLCSRYAIEQQIGDGGQGRVFQVRRISDGRRFAVKSVHVEEPRELDLVRQEVAIMRMIQGSGARSSSRCGEYREEGFLTGKQEFREDYGFHGEIHEEIQEFRGHGQNFREERQREGQGFGENHEAKIGGESLGMRGESSRGGDGTVGLVEVIVDDNNRVWHLVLELCACSLHDRIQRERGLCEREAALLIKSLAKVVQGLHRLGIVHRDLKPPNVLLSRPTFPYDVKVADFGLSVAALGGKLDHIVGTTKYLAPEVVRDSKFDQAVDIWGLGLILYEALSGVTAFAGLDSDFVLERLGWVDMPADMLDWSGVGLEAKELVLGMLCLDPKKRLTTQQIQTHPWVLKHTEEGFVPPTPSRIVKLKRLNGKWVSNRGAVQQQPQLQQQQQQQQHQQHQHQQQRKRKKSEEATRSYRKLRLSAGEPRLASRVGTIPFLVWPAGSPPGWEGDRAARTPKFFRCSLATAAKSAAVVASFKTQSEQDCKSYKLKTNVVKELKFNFCFCVFFFFCPFVFFLVWLLLSLQMIYLEKLNHY